MSYEAVDGFINSWIEDRDLTLFRAFAGRPERYWYVSGGRECFQISVAPPEGGVVMVNAWSVETDDDAEMHEAWSVPMDEISTALADAHAQIEEWLTRAKTKSPWWDRPTVG